MTPSMVNGLIAGTSRYRCATAAFDKKATVDA
jgi:hypothetical protein